jgi:acyl-CoA reductase-like NAD-dependent aldehyde dehydrogenase
MTDPTRHHVVTRPPHTAGSAGAPAAAPPDGQSSPPWLLEELLDAWRAAQHEADDARAAWNRTPGARGYATYRAAQDRADAAQDALALLTSGRGGDPA